MNRTEILETFRVENPELTERVITDSALQSMCLEGNKDVCKRARCIVGEDGTTISTTEDDERYDLTDEIDRFYDIDTFPGSGVLYNGVHLDKVTMAELDEEDENWRARSSGTPEKYYRRGKYLCLDRPIDSNAEDIIVYAVLKPDDFDAADKTPYDELDYLEPYHYALVLYLKWKAKLKIGKTSEGTAAGKEYLMYIKDMIKQLGGNKYGNIRFKPRV